jgi:NitT/TauT family transport system substrate-binding protein
LAEQLGFSKLRASEVEMLEQANHVAGASALSITNPDVLCIPYENALLFKAKGIHMVSLAQIARTPQWVLGVSNKNVPSYKSLADLRGKRMGLIDAEGSAQRCLNFILLRAGMKPSQLNWVNLNSSVHAMVALRNGQVDALFCGRSFDDSIRKKRRCHCCDRICAP